MPYEIQIAAKRAAGWPEEAISRWLEDPADHSVEDSIGPHWSDPWGCCFGECDTQFSIAFREYHGLEEAWIQYRQELKEEYKRSWKKYSRRPPRKLLWGSLGDLLGGLVKNPHDLPRYLRKRLKIKN